MEKNLELFSSDELVDELEKRFRSIVVAAENEVKISDPQSISFFIRVNGEYLRKIGLATEINNFLHEKRTLQEQ